MHRKGHDHGTDAGRGGRRTGWAKSSLRRTLNFGRIAGRKTAAGEWEVGEASLLAAYLPPLDAPKSRAGNRPESSTWNDQFVAPLRASLARERGINRHLQAERERENRDRDRALFRDLADQWRRQLPTPKAIAEPSGRPWWRFRR